MRQGTGTFHPINCRFRVTTVYPARAAHALGGRLNRQHFFSTAKEAFAFAEAMPGSARVHEAVNGETWSRNGKWRNLLKEDCR
jgi:hypothetical protein